MKKLLIRPISLILVMLMLTSALFSCGSNVDDPENGGSGNPQDPNYNGIGNESAGSIDQNGENSDEEDDVTPIIDVAEFPNGSFPLYNGKAYTVKVVNADKATAAERQIATSLRTALKSKTNATIEASTDYLKPGASHDANAYEILVGETSHEESKNVYSSTVYNNYGIKAIGKKLVIYFSSAVEGEELVKSFSKAIRSNGKGLF